MELMLIDNHLREEKVEEEKGKPARNDGACLPFLNILQIEI